jgi:hypothetical protein
VQPGPRPYDRQPIWLASRYATVEYKIFAPGLRASLDDKRLESNLNELGAEGWEHGYDRRAVHLQAVKVRLRQPVGGTLFHQRPGSGGARAPDSLWLPEDLDEALTREAKRSETGNGELIRNAIAHYLALPGEQTAGR